MKTCIMLVNFLKIIVFFIIIICFVKNTCAKDSNIKVVCNKSICT